MTNEELERAVERAMKKRDHPSSDTLGFTTLATADFDTIMKALSERAELLATVERMRGALTEIVNLCPATCETTAAHSMADIARAALNTGEGK